jgi:gluconokinase
MCNTAGTTDGIAVVCERRLDDPLNRVQSMPHIVERHGARNWIVGGAMSSGGIMLDWFGRRFYAHLADPYLVVSDEAACVPVGAEGLIVLPYLLGERSPINDPDARSVFFGISETHTRAHLARAVLESVAFAVRDVCEAITEVGAEIAEVRIAGGASRSDVWNQIKADVLGRSVLVPSVADSGMLGAAIIAGWGIGCFADLADAAQTMVKFRAKLEPNQDHHAVYSRLFNFYRGLYAHLKSDFAGLAQMRRAH